MAFTDVEKVRIEVQDNEVGFYILADTEIEYFLQKNANSIGMASIDAAKTILFKLAQQTDEVSGIFSIRGSAAAKAYREALELYIKNASLNPLFSSAGAYAAGISASDIALYQSDPDNVIKTFVF